jgi:hypothetical protein
MNLVNLVERRLNSASMTPLSHIFYDIIYKCVNRLTLLMVLKRLTIDTVDPKFLQGADGYKCEILNAERLLTLPESREYQCDRAIGWVTKISGKYSFSNSFAIITSIVAKAARITDSRFRQFDKFDIISPCSDKDLRSYVCEPEKKAT